MRIENVPFAAIPLVSCPAVRQAGEKGFAEVKTIQIGEIRMRKIEFSSGYCGDHWCSKGHVGFVLSGSLLIRLERGDVFEIPAGDGFQVGDDQDRHRAESLDGATVFLID